MSLSLQWLEVWADQSESEPRELLPASLQLSLLLPSYHPEPIATMASKSKSKKEEALQILDDLDSFAPADANATSTDSGPSGEAEVLAFLDEITHSAAKPTTTAHLERPISRSSTPVGSLRKSTEHVRLGGGSVFASTPTSTSVSASGSGGKPAVKVEPKVVEQPPQQQQQGGGWAWNSVWSTASAAIEKAKTAVDEQVKHLPPMAIPKNEQARKWGEGVMEYARGAQLDKIGIYFL